MKPSSRIAAAMLYIIQYTVLLQLLCISSVIATAPNPGPEWNTTVFLDDFEGEYGCFPDQEKWIIQNGTSYPGGPANWGTGEVQTYTADVENVKLSGNGYLMITPHKTQFGTWTSARIETACDEFEAPVGGMMRIEASISLPNVTKDNGAGYWPAFWALGGNLRQNYNAWPRIGEFDILENVNGLANVSHTMHCGVYPNGPCDEPNGLGLFSSCSGESCHSGFHTYTLVHDRRSYPERLGFYVDNMLQLEIKESDVGIATWRESVNHGLYLIVNVAMGGSFPNALYGGSTPTASTVGNYSMLVDYVAVWTALS